MVIVRIVGWIFVAAGALVVGLDFLVSIASAHWTPNAVGDLWWRVDPSSYSLAQGYLGKTIFEFWAAVALLAAGLLLILLESRRERGTETRIR